MQGVTGHPWPPLHQQTQSLLEQGAPAGLALFPFSPSSHLSDVICWQHLEALGSLACFLVRLSDFLRDMHRKREEQGTEEDATEGGLLFKPPLPTAQEVDAGT